MDSRRETPCIMCAPPHFVENFAETLDCCVSTAVPACQLLVGTICLFGPNSSLVYCWLNPRRWSGRRAPGCRCLPLVRWCSARCEKRSRHSIISYPCVCGENFGRSVRARGLSSTEPFEQLCGPTIGDTDIPMQLRGVLAARLLLLGHILLFSSTFWTT